MPGRPLKNFEDYRDTLRRASKSLGVKVVYRRIDGEAQFSRPPDTITISRDLPESTEIAVFLHELGHSLDRLLNADTVSAYPHLYRNKATPKQRSMVLACEKRAWSLGRALAKKIGIPLGKWYAEEEADCLASYREQS